MENQKLITGKIYKIINTETPDIYIGSTTQPLSERFRKHKTSSRNIHRNSKLYKFMRKIGTEKFSIVLIKKIKCSNINELHKIEDEFRINEKATLNTYSCVFNQEKTKQYQKIIELITKKIRKNMTSNITKLIKKRYSIM